MMKISNENGSSLKIKIINSGKEGAEYSALLVADKLSIDTGGYSSPYYKLVNDDIDSKYNIRLVSNWSNPYIVKRLVDESDATILFNFQISDHILQVIKYCKWKELPFKCMKPWWENLNSIEEYYKPLLIIVEEDLYKYSSTKDTLLYIKEKILRFLNYTKAKTIYITGNRESMKENSAWMVENLLYLPLEEYIK